MSMTTVRMIEPILFFAIAGLLWGSFLNVVAYRLLHDETPFFPQRSYCPTCHHTLAWYDLIPLISFALLGGKCRYCQQKISLLYPFIELTTALIFVYYYLFIPTPFLVPSLLLASLFIITIRTDFEEKTIFRITTLFAIPSVYLASYFGLLPLDIFESFLSSIVAYSILWFVRVLARWYAGQEALGLGDVELFALIASVGGFFGAWASLTLAATIGSIHGLIQKFIKPTLDPRIPLGAYLALASLSIFPVVIWVF